MSLWLTAGEGRRSTALRAGGMIVVGLCLVLAFPPFDLWFTAALAPGAAALLVRDQPLRRSALLGVVLGLAFFLPLMWWTGMEVGPIPWVLLGILEASFFVLLTMGFTVVQRLPGWPVWIAAVWIAVEAFRGRFPWGGLTWGKLAFAQADGPFTGLAALGGTPLVSFAVALVSGLLAWLVVSTDRWTRVVAAGAAAAVTVSGLFVSPPAPDGDTITVASVQGNVPAMGLDYNARARVVTENHVAATHQLVRDVENGSVRQPDLVIWPENSSDINPFADPTIYADIDRAVAAIGVPVVLSAIIPTGDGRHKENTSILWDPEQGPTQTYVKRRPMPFGEYIPFRDIAALITDAVNRQPLDQIAGDEVGVFSTDVGSIALAICFEVGFDEIVRDAVVDGGQFLAVQTNNATFRDSPMSEQHLAQSRLRAVEHGRSVIVSALSGISAVIGPDGTVEQRTELFTQDVLVADVRLSDETTVATTVGAWPEWVIVGLALGAVVAGIALTRRPTEVDSGSPREPEPVAAGV
ncbi:apolipoprotein N-acyltransferase [Phytoactinopolyspora halotolerans]|uniref:Apolipoprotein N-acyltransferase n=1 Tax=Phytoactinopolyspora halotolerans TaxID=1981512 RepID=A0A6L9SA03_9ACTN|nr:apolipoprotein N-acyltransferase [Phytoactinopolyspora halotolerans]NEE01392.1 apolipoprotein N-acyltransferase [Phytoactinopolyspora halotolerans]